MLSICMIVKNEAAVLNDCLSSLKGLIDTGCELVVIDTGSEDETRNIAMKYTDKVYDFTWCNDFSAARNFSISKASQECIMAIDADEELISCDIEGLRKCIRICTSGIPPVGRSLCRNIYEYSGEQCTMLENKPRIFSRKHFKYSGIIHEQIIPVHDYVNHDFMDIPLVFEHRGYNGDETFINQKTSRNIKLLEQACKDAPEDSYLLYQLGKSYFMRKDYMKSHELFDKCLYFDLDPKLEYVQDLIESYGYSLINTEQYEKALQLSGVYEDFSTSCEFVFLMGLIYMNNGLFDAAINELKKAATFPSCKIEGSNSYLANYNIAVIYECTGDKTLARNYYKKCGRYEPAKQRLRKL